MMILKDRCSITRMVKGAKSPTGAVKMEEKTIVESLPCYIEDDDGVVIVPQEGQTIVSYHVSLPSLGAWIEVN